MIKIITVIPLKKNVWRDNLSYFTTQDVPLGSIVSVPSRKQQIDALVIGSRNADELKSELKTVDWQLRKMTKVKKSKYLPPEFIDAVQMTAEYFAAPIGAIAKSTLPQAVLDNLPEIKTLPTAMPEKIIPETVVIQEGPEERLARYKSLIREAFAKKQSIYFCLPTATDIERLAEPLSRGIEAYTLIGHGQLSKHEQVNFWQQALSIQHPILIIATPLFLALPRTDIAILIIEEESSPAYKMLTRPFIDWRWFAERLAQQKKIKLIFGDQALRSETIYRLGIGEISALSTIKYRLSSNANSQIIDEKQQADYITQALSERLRDHLENALDRQERFFIYVGRRGLAPLTICRDCGTIMACEICHSPLAIHQSSRTQTKAIGDRVFICHKCGQIVEIEDQCSYCHGQRLALLGFGVEKIIEEIKQGFPTAKISRLDSDTVKTAKQAKEIIRHFVSTPGGILVGTELALNYLNTPIDNVAGISLDSFLTRPDWRASEKLFQILLRLKRLSNKNFILQTRQPDEKIFSYSTTGNLIDFYRDEIEERQILGYPPFKILIKISLAGKPTDIGREMKHLAEALTAWQPLVYPSLTKNSKGLAVINLLLRLSKHQAKKKQTTDNNWPIPTLSKILKNLPPTFVVEIDPENIL